MNKFKQLGLDGDTLKVVDQLGYEEPTDIQQKTIPPIISGRNIIAQSATGTGKTFAFLAGLLQNIDCNRKIQVLVVTPTRELANQILEESKRLTKFKRQKSCVVYGGVPLGPQTEQLRKSEIVITTPGRILDHIKRGNVNLENVKALVLDEADRMCDMGFYDDISKIIKYTPKEKQMLLFSATISRDITKLEKKYILNAHRIVVEYYVDPTKLLQEYYKVKNNEKISLLIHLLAVRNKKALIFCNTRSIVDMIYHNLKEQKIECYRLHGGLEQRSRTRIIGEYQNHKNAVLVSTDVAARGIHIDNINAIYNFDLPKDDTQYIHRIGRTARAGKEGTAISLISTREESDFLRMCKKFKFKVVLNDRPKYSILDIKRPIRKSSRDYSTSSFRGRRSDSRGRRSDSGDMDVNVVTKDKIGDLEKKLKQDRVRRRSHLGKHRSSFKKKKHTGSKK